MFPEVDKSNVSTLTSLPGEWTRYDPNPTKPDYAEASNFLHPARKETLKYHAAAEEANNLENAIYRISRQKSWELGKRGATAFQTVTLPGWRWIYGKSTLPWAGE